MPSLSPHRPLVLLALIVVMAAIFLIDTVTDYAVAAACFYAAVILAASRVLAARGLITHGSHRQQDLRGGISAGCRGNRALRAGESRRDRSRAEHRVLAAAGNARFAFDGEPEFGYQVHLGGGLASSDRAEPGLGRTVRGLKVSADELPGYVERVVRRFADDHEDGESFSAWAKRSDEEALR